MSDEFVGVASFWNTAEAQLAKNRLDEHGIRAFLSGEAVGMLLYYTNAVGGVKLLVEEKDAEEARSLLTEHADSTELNQSARDEAAEAQPDIADESEESDDVAPTNREEAADRAFRGAIIGLFLLPLQLYVFWLLLRIFASDQTLAGKHRTRAIVAALINLPLMIGFCYLLRLWLHG
jgi:Putative prokaryotic signal transducing protein